MITSEEDIQKLVDLLKSASRIAVLTGAGMSTESGIPDYRSTDGLYQTLTSEEVFDIDRFNGNPRQFYRVIGPLYCSIVEARPNQGHLALHQLEQNFGKRVDIATQNIDGLHQKAGSERVYEVHGTMATLTCRRCGGTSRGADHLAEFKEGAVLRCACGGVYKPDITFYGENLPEDVFSRSLQAFSQCDLALVLGTSLVVYPAACLPGYRRSGVPLVIINRTATSSDREAALVIRDSIGEILPRALEKMDQ